MLHAPSTYLSRLSWVAVLQARLPQRNLKLANKLLIGKVRDYERVGGILACVYCCGDGEFVAIDVVTSILVTRPEMWDVFIFNGTFFPPRGVSTIF